MELKSKVQLQGDITVTFHNEPLVSEKRMGLIYELGFNGFDQSVGSNRSEYFVKHLSQASQASQPTIRDVK